jgi:hypothetical protein
MFEDVDSVTGEPRTHRQHNAHTVPPPMPLMTNPNPPAAGFPPGFSTSQQHLPGNTYPPNHPLGQQHPQSFGHAPVNYLDPQYQQMAVFPTSTSKFNQAPQSVVNRKKDSIAKPTVSKPTVPKPKVPGGEKFQNRSFNARYN